MVNLLSLPRHPPYTNISHLAEMALWKYIGMCASQGPGSLGSTQPVVRNTAGGVWEKGGGEVYVCGMLISKIASVSHVKLYE